MPSKAVSHAHANLDLADAVGSFTRHLRAENLAASTVATYVKALNQLNSFLVQQGMPTDVAASGWLPSQPSPRSSSFSISSSLTQ